MKTRTVTDSENRLTISSGHVEIFSAKPATQANPFRFIDSATANGWAAHWADGFAQVYRLEKGVMTEELARAACGKNDSWTVRFVGGKATIEIHHIASNPA